MKQGYIYNMIRKDNMRLTCCKCKSCKPICCVFPDIYHVGKQYCYCDDCCPSKEMHINYRNFVVKENKPMRRFYTTMSPDSARHILRDTAEEAISKATNEVLDDGRTRYVVEIIYKVEKDNPPVKVTKL